MRKRGSAHAGEPGAKRARVSAEEASLNLLDTMLESSACEHLVERLQCGSVISVPMSVASAFMTMDDCLASSFAPVRLPVETKPMTLLDDGPEITLEEDCAMPALVGDPDVDGEV